MDKERFLKYELAPSLKFCLYELSFFINGIKLDSPEFWKNGQKNFSAMQEIEYCPLSLFTLETESISNKEINPAFIYSSIYHYEKLNELYKGKFGFKESKKLICPNIHNVDSYSFLKLPEYADDLKISGDVDILNSKYCSSDKKFESDPKEYPQTGYIIWGKRYPPGFFSSYEIDPIIYGKIKTLYGDFQARSYDDYFSYLIAPYKYFLEKKNPSVIVSVDFHESYPDPDGGYDFIHRKRRSHFKPKLLESFTQTAGNALQKIDDGFAEYYKNFVMPTYLSASGLVKELLDFIFKNNLAEIVHNSSIDNKYRSINCENFGKFASCRWLKIEKADYDSADEEIRPLIDFYTSFSKKMNQIDSLVAKYDTVKDEKYNALVKVKEQPKKPTYLIF